VRRRIAVWLAAPSGAALALLAYAFLVPLGPLEARVAAPGTVVLAANGSVLYRDAVEGIRIPIALADIAPIAVQATLAAEDQRFYLHPGVDPLAVARAAAQVGRNPSGASTITQQLARRLYLSDTRLPLPLRKAREALVALQLEARYSKDTLLETYLNDIYYGRGAYGIEAAARVYFGVGAHDLDLAQASFLAGLPQRPVAYDPAEHEAAARARQRYVLDRLVAVGAVEHAAADLAAARRLALLPAEPEPPAPHFVGYVFDALEEIEPGLGRRPGLVVETTLDAALQVEAVRSVRDRLAVLERKDASTAAVVVVEPGTGRLLAMVGSAEPSAPGGQVNAALALRQPGSALKPFVYAAALEAGYTPAAMVLDVPTVFETPGGPYVPHNYDLQFHGPVTVRVALGSSLNVPAVRTVAHVGIDRFLELAQRVGLGSLQATEVYGVALALGGGEVRLLDLTAAYAALADGGRLAHPYAIERVRDASGRVLYEHDGREPARVLSEQHAFLLADILADPLARLPGFGASTPLETPFRAAVKTGTSSAFRDNWTLGFTATRAVGVWVGNADGRPMRDVSGIDGAAPIWRDVMTAAARSAPAAPFAPPSGVVRASVCAPTGGAAAPDCPAPAEDWFVAGTDPGARSDYYHRDPVGLVSTLPPSEAQAWGLDAGLRLTRDAEPSAPGVHILSPVPGSVLYFAPELERQEVLLRASVPAGTVRVEFRVGGVLVASVEGDDARALWPLAAGRHHLEVTAFGAAGAVWVGSALYDVGAR
jgi:penicillin-binding protein 1C